MIQYPKLVIVNKMPPKPKGQLFTDWVTVTVPTCVWGIDVPVGSRYRMHESRDAGYLNVDPPIDNRRIFRL